MGYPRRPSNEQVRWGSVITFYVLACAISWPFLWWRDIRPDTWAAWPVPELLKHASYMWGPGVAALVCFGLFRRSHLREVTLVGSSWARSTAFYVLPLGALAVVGGKPFGGMNAHTFPLLAIDFSFLTVFGEELGWRGFLQDALTPLRRGPRYALIGVLWEGWHFTTRTHEGSAIEIALRLLVSIPALIVLSWIIGLAVERTRSLLVAHSIHCWINLVLQVPSWQASTVFVASVALWLGLLRGWPEREAAGQSGRRC